MPTVSVIIPSYNHEHFIRECIQSVLDQTYQDFEIIITDDCSTDHSVKVIESFNDLRIKLFKFQKNQGACVAANNCILHSKGKYIAMLSSDDVWYSQKLSVQVKYLDEHPEVAVVFGKVEWIDEFGNLITNSKFPYRDTFNVKNRTRFEWLRYFFEQGNCLCHPCSLVRRTCYSEVGMLNPALAGLPDFDLWIRICLKYDIKVLDQKLIGFRRIAEDINASGDNIKNRIRNRYEHRQILNHYLKIKQPDELLLIFPNAARYGKVEANLIHYFLGRIAIDSGWDIKMLWGLDVINNILKDERLSKILNEKYNFSYLDYINLVSECDIHRISLLAQATEREQQPSSLAGQYHKLTSSKAWRAALLARRLLPPGSSRLRLAEKMRPILLFPFSLRQKQLRNQEARSVRASGFFDPDWYLAHNPDVAQAGMNPLIHYLQYGGFEGRDPGSKFSSAWYLGEYEDIKKAGVNPLVHYIKYGKEEGRKPQPAPSMQTPSFNVASVSDNWGNMKFGLVTIIKNEQDILNTFLNHIDALFDYVLLIDHRSDDNTRDILRKAASLRKNWIYIALDINGFYQKEISKLGMKYLFERGADFVFFLDCDEFIQVESRKDLELKVRGVINPPVAGSFRWINCLPDDIESQQCDRNSKILKIMEDSQYSKIFIPRSLYNQHEGNLFLVNGNHQVLDSTGKDLGSKEIGHIIHLPVRSRKQLIQKGIIGSLTRNREN